MNAGGAAMSAQTQGEDAIFFRQASCRIANIGISSSHFEQTQVLTAAVQIPAQGAEHSGNRRRAHGRSFMAERILKDNRWAVGEAGVFRRVDHGVRDYLAITVGHQNLSDGQILVASSVMFHTGRRRTNALGQMIVADHARDFLNEIDFPSEVKTPGRGRDAPTFTTRAFDCATQGTQNVSDIFLRRVCAKDAADFTGAQGDLPRSEWARVDIDDARQNTSTREFGNQCGGAIQGSGRHLDIRASFEPVRRLSVHPE